MRRLLKAWVLVVALVALTASSFGSIAGAQQIHATVATGPSIGDPVSYITESGSEVAELRASEVILEWDGFNEYYVPSPGKQYMVVVVEVTNLGTRGMLIVRSDDFRLQDADGFFLSRSWADASEDSEIIPSESEVGVAPGETEDVVLVYEVLTGVGLSHLFWQPEFERLITIANLDEYVPGQD